MRDNSLDNKLQYITNLYALELREQKDIRVNLEFIGRAINISPLEGKILQVLTSLIKPKKIVEIGTLHGYSTIWLALACSEAEIHTFELEQENACLAQKNFDSLGFKNIHIHVGDAVTCLKNIEDKGKFDLVFIDANKSAYLTYLEWCDKNLASGGVIIADNTLLSGAVCDDNIKSKFSSKNIEKMRIFNEILADQSKYISVMLPTSEGLSIAIKK